MPVIAIEPVPVVGDSVNVGVTFVAFPKASYPRTVKSYVEDVAISI
jgi:hypothetical protein